MWYVIQTRTGEEDQVKAMVESLQDRDAYRNCFIPLYEDVRRSRGRYSITFRRMFPGYFFIDTKRPEVIFRTLKRIPEFTRILGSEGEDGSRIFIPVGIEDEEFLLSLLDDGIMHSSYIKMKNKRIDKVVGPLAKYRNHISKLDIPHRRAIVEVEMFGKKRRIRFGLWLDGDPSIPWLERQLGNAQEEALDEGADIDIGIYPGDRVIDETGLYGDMVFTVKSVDPGRRTIYTTFEMLGTMARLELGADSVRKVEPFD